MNTYLLTSAIIFLILGLIWKKSDLLNMLCKIFIFGLGIIGLFYWLQNSGYLIKI